MYMNRMLKMQNIDSILLHRVFSRLCDTFGVCSHVTPRLSLLLTETSHSAVSAREMPLASLSTPP